MENKIFIKDNNVRDILEKNFYNGDNPIGDTLSNIFLYNSQGKSEPNIPLHDNLLPLVEFTKSQLALFSLTLNGNEREFNHLILQIESVINSLDKLAKKSTNSQNSYQKQAEYARVLLKDLKERPNHVKTYNFIQILVNNWEHFKNLEITYRLLMDITKLEKGWRNYDTTKDELLMIIKKVTDEWE